MIGFKSAFVASLSLLATSSLASAQTKPSDPSVYLRCDGNPPHRSGGELLGRVLLMSATLGLAGQGETRDVSKRAHGIDGVDACDTAILGESDPIRKVQLMLARAIHHIEAGDYAGAAEDARKAPSLAGPGADDIGFRHTLLFSSLELQAAALVRQGNFRAAEAAALQMADAAPYDVIAQTRAIPYMLLTAELTPEKQAYLDRLVKLMPSTLAFRAVVYQWAGKFLEAAADYDAVIDLRAGFITDGSASPAPAFLGARSVMLALGGRMEESARAAADTAAMIRVLAATGKSGLMQTSIDEAEQALDFQAIIMDLAQGRAGAARIKFAARSHWSVPATPSVAELATRLRQNAPPGELTGPLADDPATLRANGLIANAGAITEAANANALLYNVVRVPLDAGTYKSWTDDVWNTKASPFLHQKAANENYAGELLVVSRTPGFFAPPHTVTIAAGEALLLHAALLAEARGAKGFVLFPLRNQLVPILLRFGNPGEPGIPAAATFDAASVVADLTDEFPDPRMKAGAAAAK